MSVGVINNQLIVLNTYIVCCLGDLIYSAEDVLNSELWLGGAWNAEIGIANRNRVICTANYIVPGHGSVFRVTPQMRYIAKCSGNGDNDIGIQINK